MAGIEGFPQLITSHPEVLPAKPKLPLVPSTSAVPVSESLSNDALALEQARATIKEAITNPDSDRPKTNLKDGNQITATTARAESESVKPESPTLQAIKEMDQRVAVLNEKATALANKLRVQANDAIYRLAQKFQDPSWKEQATAYFSHQSDKLARGVKVRWEDSKLGLIKLTDVSEQYLTRLLTEGPMGDIMTTITENLLQKSIQLLPRIMELQTISIKL
jgi:hypothetical protein